MKINHGLVMVLSALSAGLLVSCVKPVDDNTATDMDNQKVTQEPTKAKAAAGSSEQIEAIDISAETASTYLTHVANDIVIPAYANTAKQSAQLQKLAQQSCQQAPVSGNALQKMRDQWLLLAQAWARAEMINFGPATDSMSNLYVNYYPDERGVVHSGVADLIAANPTLTAAQLENESAIVQGIPGLEEALHANDSLDGAQCAYVVSASSALSTRLKAIENNWRDNATTLLAIDKTADSDQGLNQWFNALLSLVEITKTNAIDQPLGITGSTKGHLPAATAKQSRAIITAKVDTLNQTLTDPALVALLGRNNESLVSDNLSTALSDTTALLAQMPEDIADADKAEQQALFDHFTTMTRLIKRELIPTLGVRVGFNSNDGD